jgi:hypothetical protein
MHEFLLTVKLAEHPAGTQLTWQQAFDQPIDAGLERFLASANEQNLDRLSACFEQSSGPG